MNTELRISKHLKEILKEMCRRVNADFNKMDFTEGMWFHKYSWTEKEQDDFEKWLINYLSNNREARKEMMRFPRKDKKSIERLAKEFILMYGWIIK